MGEPIVRTAEAGDVPALLGIYNHYVTNTPITFHVTPLDLEERRAWFEGFAPSGRHQLLVVEQSGEVLGYAGTMPYRPKPAYERSVETTIYLRPDAHGRGLGSRLYAELFERLAGGDAHLALAGITLPNAASLALHARFGFRDAGVLREVGFKFGRYWDVAWLQKPLAT